MRARLSFRKIPSIEMSAKPELRPPRDDDAPAIASLLGHLGYPATEAEAEQQLAAVRRMPTSLLLVAAVDKDVLGLITCHLFSSVHSRSPVAWITTLVVSPRAQGTGVGTMLLKEGERWAAENGAERVSLTSAHHRTAAHAFYETRGYRSTGLRLSKSL
jgi:GNAT superfamily N-acetyltransferase